jgi:membrane fusion protein, multidrug efflux system
MKSRKLRARAASLRSSGVVAAALVTLTLLGGCQNRAAKKDERHETQSKQGPAQITVENGQTFITLDAATQKRLGFTVATLASTVTRAQATFPAVVVSVQELATFRNTYVAAQAQLQKARIQAGVAEKEYARLKALFEENQNVSEKSLQSAEAALQSDDADVQAAEQQLNLQASALRQEWGGVVTEWATEGSAQFQRLVDRGQALVEMTMPAGTTFAPPKTISLELPGGSRRQAIFVSTFPRVDPRIQGRSILYLASGQPELPPGLNLVAHLPVGSPLKGVVIPASAVVWSEDKAWVYAQVSPERFSRSPVPTDVPVEDGFFAGEGFSAGDKIVTVGAQALLSEEMLLHSQGGSDEN